MMSMPASRWRPIVDWISRRPGISLTLFLLPLACLLMLGWARSEGSPIDADMLSLVMPADGVTVQEKARERIQKAAERSQTWLVSHPDRALARVAAGSVERMLENSGLYEPRITDLSPISIISFYEPYHFRLADDDSLAAATQTTPDVLVEHIIRSLYRSSAMATTSLETDPFLLHAGFLADLASTPPPFSIDDGILTGRLDDAWVYLISNTLNRGAFDLEARRVMSGLQAEVAQLEVKSGAKIRSVGAVDFAVANQALAVNEIRVIGGTSLVLVLALLFLTFRHPRPFLAIGVIVLVAVTGGFAVCLLTFKSIHVMTLIAGSSLVGISVDYAFHLLSDGYRADDPATRWTVSHGLISVLPATSLGLATSLLGLSGLYASGFVGLQQIAIFSGAGLICAWLCLLFCSPALLGSWQPARRHTPSLGLAARWSRFYRPGRKTILMLSVSGGAALLFLPAPSTNNDIRLLTAQTPQIDRLVELSATLSAHLLDSRFLLVQAEDDEALLQMEERIRPQLRSLVSEGAISHFSQMSRFVPSLQRQNEVLSANRSLIESPGTAIEQLQTLISLREEVVADLRLGIRAAAEEQPLRLEQFHTSPLKILTENLYLGTIDGMRSSITTFAAVSDPERLKTVVAAMPGVTLVDNVSNISSAFGLYVVNARQGLIFAFLLVGVLMMWRFGLADGATSMLVPLNAFIVTVFCLQALGESLNLFHIVGLTLVLGTGMDYTIFLKSGRRRPETMLAVLLAAITTECAFGLLGSSRVGAIHSFGITVAIGTMATFLLAPMVAEPDAKPSP